MCFLKWDDWLVRDSAKGGNYSSPAGLPQKADGIRMVARTATMNRCFDRPAGISVRS
jgi:hypothetical protein